MFGPFGVPAQSKQLAFGTLVEEPPEHTPHSSIEAA